jgi:uroporphyrinogen-III synthase
MCQNSLELAQFLVKNHKNDSFSFFCGKRRRPEIETVLEQHKIRLEVHELYQTYFTAKHFETHFDGILFFSPSAVTSFFMKNNWPVGTHGFCIGTTTAAELEKYTSEFSTAKQPSESHLLVTLHHYYKQHYVKK